MARARELSGLLPAPAHQYSRPDPLAKHQLLPERDSKPDERLVLPLWSYQTVTYLPVRSSGPPRVDSWLMLR